jgi:hypothetical protein
MEVDFMTVVANDFFQEPLDFKKFDLFKTESDNTYITFMGVTYPLKGSKFSRLLNQLYFELTEFFPEKGLVKGIIDNLDMYATLFCDCKEIFYRFARLGDTVYIDSGNEQFDVIEISGDSIKIVTNPPAKFIRSTIERKIGAPDLNAVAKDLNLLKKYVPFKSEQDFVLFVSWLLSCMNTNGGYPPLFLIGEQGSAKSTTTAFIKDLLDNSAVPLRNLSKSMRDLMIAASNDYILCYDNISEITDKQSDSLCKLATGAGFTTRKLYTSTEETQLTCKRPTVINTISFIPTRQDLLDRSVIVFVNHIKPEERKTVKELWESWHQDRPLIFGALCHAVSAALRNYDKVNEENLPRMADFAKWVTAAEEQLPWEKGLFLETLENSRIMTVEDTIEAEPVAMTILNLMADKGQWIGNASELLDALDNCIDQARNRYPGWPKIPNQLTRKIGRVSAFLREKGILVEKRHSGERFIEIMNLNHVAKEDDIRKIMGEVRSAFSEAPLSPELPEISENNDHEDAALVMEGSGRVSDF